MSPPARQQRQRRPDLLIGWGNSLRQDDGVGLAIAEQVQGWNRPGLKVLAIPQLTPELAPQLADAARVLFVDAALAAGCPAPGWTLEQLPRRSPGPQPLSHHASPGALLQLAGSLYGRTPPAWQLLVRAHSCELGTELTAATAALLPEALAAVGRWCGDA
ncbi:MAG: hydrogenase maturation protease [Cyanobium sp. CZS 48M]|nr:hydrogenase maturation protease [Cyanobium sp. CZS48M]